MGDFTLGTSTLAGSNYRTQTALMFGEFREIQFRLTQAGSSEDMEVHFLEFHYTDSGVSEEASPA